MAKKFTGTIKLDVRDSVSDWDAFTDSVRRVSTFYLEVARLPATDRP